MKDKGKLTEWIAIGVSIILGLTSLYWNYQTQQNIVNQQIETQKQIANAEQEAKFAHLNFSNYVATYGCLMGCPNVFEISNMGPAVAQNVTITSAVSYISDNWKPSISDITGFNFTTYPRTEEITKKLIPGSRPSDGIMEFTINSLMPGGLISIEVEPRYPTSVQTPHPMSVSANVFVYPSGQPFAKDSMYSLADKVLYQFLQEKFLVADLEIGVTCVTCKESPSNTFPFESGLNMAISSINEAYENPINIQKSQNGYLWQGTLNVAYEELKGMKPIQLQASLYFRATEYNISGQPDIKNYGECQPTTSSGSANYCGQ